MKILGKPFLLGCLTGALLFVFYFHFMKKPTSNNNFSHLDIEIVEY